jgi:hypothetical protein
MLVLTAEPKSLEMGTVHQRRRDLGSKRLDAEVVPPDLAVLRILQNLSLERRFVVDTWIVKKKRV